MHCGRGLVGPAVLVAVTLVLSTGTLAPIASSHPAAPIDAPGQVPGPDVGADATELDSCTRITDPGVYQLTADVEDSQGTQLSESCIRIDADDVVFDGDGHRIDGRGISDTRGVMVNGSNVIVRDVGISDWDRGVYYRNVAGGAIHDVNVTGNGYGIALERTGGVTMGDNDIRANVIGIYIDRSPVDVDLRDNRVRGNHLVDVKRTDPTDDEG